METTKNSILNALLQQAMFAASNNNGGGHPVNLSLSTSMASYDEGMSEVTSSGSSTDDEPPADLSRHRHQHRGEASSSTSAEENNGHNSSTMQQPLHPDLMQAMAAAFSFQQNLIQQQPMSTSPSSSSSPDPANLVAKALASATMRRPRSEKKPIPDDLKDNKYYERRRRNNLAVSFRVPLSSLKSVT